LYKIGLRINGKNFAINITNTTSTIKQENKKKIKVKGNKIL